MFVILESRIGIERFKEIRERLKRDYGKIKERWDCLWNVKDKHDEQEREYDELVLSINQDRVYNI